MQDYVVKISFSDRIKDPAVALDELFAGSFHYELVGRVEADKLIGWSELATPEGKVLATRTIFDWGI